LLENLMGLAAKSGQLRNRPGPKDAQLRHARVCYNHLAGNLGVQMYNHLLSRGYLQAKAEQLTLTPPGRRFASDFGIDLAALDHSKTPLCRECLDWSERRSHLAGSLGRAFLARIEVLGWAKRIPDTRIVDFTKTGSAAFAQAFPQSATPHDADMSVIT
jgi:hypothetical protein